MTRKAIFSEAPFNVIVAATVQFDATAYVAVRGSVVITPSVFSVTSPDTCLWLGQRDLGQADGRGAERICAAMRKRVGATQRGV